MTAAPANLYKRSQAGTTQSKHSWHTETVRLIYLCICELTCLYLRCWSPNLLPWVCQAHTLHWTTVNLLLYIYYCFQLLRFVTQQQLTGTESFQQEKRWHQWASLSLDHFNIFKEKYTKSGIGPSVTTALRTWSLEDQGFEVIFSHLASSRPVWDTWELVSNKN